MLCLSFCLVHDHRFSSAATVSDNSPLYRYCPSLLISVKVESRLNDPPRQKCSTIDLLIGFAMFRVFVIFKVLLKFFFN